MLRARRLPGFTKIDLDGSTIDVLSETDLLRTRRALGRMLDWFELFSFSLDADPFAARATGLIALPTIFCFLAGSGLPRSEFLRFLRDVGGFCETACLVST